MMAYVDGKRINPIRVNTMMTGIPVKKSTTSIIIKYLPPLDSHAAVIINKYPL